MSSSITSESAPSERAVQLAHALAEARRTDTQLDPGDWAGAVRDAGEAYAVQALVWQHLGWSESGPGVWKSGGPAPDQLVHARLPADGVRTTGASYGNMVFHQPRIEAEVALRLGRDVRAEEAATVDIAAAASLIDAWTVSIEVVDTRWRSGGAPVDRWQNLADGQVHGALVLGEWHAATDLAAHDWMAQRCEVVIGSETTTWTGTHNLNSPLALVPGWLRHLTRNGGVAPAGSVVTTGTWCGMLPVVPGQAVRVRFDGLGVAALTL